MLPNKDNSMALASPEMALRSHTFFLPMIANCYATLLYQNVMLSKRYSKPMNLHLFRRLTMIKHLFFFSTNTPRAIRVDIKSFLNATSTEPLEKYLGLPLSLAGGKNKLLLILNPKFRPNSMIRRASFCHKLVERS